jgi:hypothetical protein
MKAKERGVDCEDLTLAVGGSAGLELMSQSETTLRGHQHQGDEDTLNDDLVRSAKETPRSQTSSHRDLTPLDSVEHYDFRHRRTRYAEIASGHLEE